MIRVSELVHRQCDSANAGLRYAVLESEMFMATFVLARPALFMANLLHTTFELIGVCQNIDAIIQLKFIIRGDDQQGVNITHG